MEISFSKFDRISEIEDYIQGLLPLICDNDMLLVNNKYFNASSEQQMLYISTILAILYKEKHHMIYLLKKAKVFDSNLASDFFSDVSNTDLLINEIEFFFKQGLIFEDFVVVFNNRNFIKQVFDAYFERKTTNYILKNSYFEFIQSHQRLKYFLEQNPFVINQFLQYNVEKLTKEEIFINDIIEFNGIAMLSLDIDDEMFDLKRIKLVKKQILRNYSGEQLSDLVLFMISDIYQEIMDFPQDCVYKMIKSIVENDNVDNDKLVDFFIKNDDFSKIVIGKFFDYNIEIKRGRLFELKNKPSYYFAKKRYK